MGHRPLSRESSAFYVCSYQSESHTLCMFPHASLSEHDSTFAVRARESQGGREGGHKSWVQAHRWGLRLPEWSRSWRWDFCHDWRRRGQEGGAVHCQQGTVRLLTYYLHVKTEVVRIWIHGGQRLDVICTQAHLKLRLSSVWHFIIYGELLWFLCHWSTKSDLLHFTVVVHLPPPISGEESLWEITQRPKTGLPGPLPHAFPLWSPGLDYTVITIRKTE